MISKIPAVLLSTALFCSEGSHAFTAMSKNDSGLPTSLNYANSEAVAETASVDSFRNSILSSYEREEAPITSSQLVTEQLSREFTTARRYLLAAATVKELSEDFYEAEEQQRVRAMELIEFARNNGIKLSDYASDVDSSPIDTSLDQADFLKELILHEKQDVKLLDQVMAKSASNQDLVSYLQSVRSDHVDRQYNLMQALSDSVSAFDIDSSMSTVDSAAVAATAQTSSVDAASRFSEDLIHKVDLKDSIQSIARWYENQLHGLGRNLEIMASRAAHVSATGATAATAAAVDSVDPELLDALPMNSEDIMQAMDSASNFFEEPAMLVDTFQQTIFETGTLSQIVDVVSGLY